MACQTEIHVGDIGTVYQAVVSAEGMSSDPDVAELIFLMPNNTVITKTAVVTPDGSPATSWTLEYEVQPGDGIGSPGEFHDNAGAFQMQAFVHFPDGKQFHTKIQTVDTDGFELRIFPNLD
jgi:hypothetical protein